MPFINENDSPELLKASVNGQPGYLLLPQGEEIDEIAFESHEALIAWTQRLMEKVQHAQYAQPFEEWLEMYR